MLWCLWSFLLELGLLGNIFFFGGGGGGGGDGGCDMIAAESYTLGTSLLEMSC